MHSFLVLEGSSDYNQGQALPQEDPQQQQQEGLSHDDSQHQGMWTDISSWLGGENFETLVLVALCLGLWAVVGRRQALRRRQLFSHHGPPPAAGNSSAAAAAAAAAPTSAAVGIATPAASSSSAAEVPAPPLAAASTAAATNPAAPAQNAVQHTEGTQASQGGPTSTPIEAQPADAAATLRSEAAALSQDLAGLASASQSPTEEGASAATSIKPPDEVARDGHHGGTTCTPLPSASAPDSGRGAAGLQSGASSTGLPHRRASQEGAGPAHSAAGQQSPRHNGRNAESAQAGPSSGVERAVQPSEFRLDWQAATGARFEGAASQRSVRASDAWWPHEDQAQAGSQHPGQGPTLGRGHDNSRSDDQFSSEHQEQQH